MLRISESIPCSTETADDCYTETENDYVRASDFFQDWKAKVTYGAKNGGPFSEMLVTSISN